MTNVRFETSDEDPWLNAVLVEADGDGRATRDRAAAPPGAAVAARTASATAASSTASRRHTSATGQRLAGHEVVVEGGELDQGEHVAPRHGQRPARAAARRTRAPPSGTVQTRNCGESTLPEAGERRHRAERGEHHRSRGRPGRRGGLEREQRDHARSSTAASDGRHGVAGRDARARRSGGCPAASASPSPSAVERVERTRPAALDLHRAVQLVA